MEAKINSEPALGRLLYDIESTLYQMKATGSNATFILNEFMEDYNFRDGEQPDLSVIEGGMCKKRRPSKRH